MNPSSSLCLRAVDFYPERKKDPDGGAGESNGRTLEGYAAVFDSPTEINSFEGHFTETIARGAFRKTLREKKPVLQFDHGHDARTGSVPIGKFDSITEDEHGLRVSASLFDNPVVEPIRQAIEGEAISGMSFRFKVVRDEWRDAKNRKVRSDELLELLYDAGERGPLHRNIKEVQLFEAGPVVFPAYEGTSVGVRSMTDEDKAELVRAYARSMKADADQEDEIREAAEIFAEEYEREDVSEAVKGKHGPQAALADPLLREGYTPESVLEAVKNDDLSLLRKDDAARSGTSSETRETETSEDAAPFAGTSAGERARKLRDLRMERYAS